MGSCQVRAELRKISCRSGWVRLFVSIRSFFNSLCIPEDCCLRLFCSIAIIRFKDICCLPPHSDSITRYEQKSPSSTQHSHRINPYKWHLLGMTHFSIHCIRKRTEKSELTLAPTDGQYNRYVLRPAHGSIYRSTQNWLVCPTWSPLELANLFKEKHTCHSWLCHFTCGMSGGEGAPIQYP